MKIQFPKILLCALFLVLTYVGCKKDKAFPDTPNLKWDDYEIMPENGPIDEIVLNLAFTDGDGDIGSGSQNAYDTCNSQSYDLFIRYFEKVGGSYQEVFPVDTTSCLYFHQRFPDITPEGQNKILEGNIYAPFIFLGFPSNANVDTIKFEVVLKDRAGNKSNVATSPGIFIPPL
ncbi:hypothetical protein [Owenweeksia hongkongensis]|uniref:hypothetical protein n=1 Tax=Owenweeksia hongkongensis TaxID=253245 RepID=UPI003A93B23D